MDTPSTGGTQDITALRCGLVQVGNNVSQEIGDSWQGISSRPQRSSDPNLFSCSRYVSFSLQAEVFTAEFAEKGRRGRSPNGLSARSDGALPGLLVALP